MKSWAANRTTDVDELFALLTGLGKTRSLAQIVTTAPGEADDRLRASAVSASPAPAERWPWNIGVNPKDTASLHSLGNIYFAAADYTNASTWEQKILTVDPKNQEALLAFGAAQFNSGNAAEAKKRWRVAARLYPQSAEVHYDLGFPYLSQTPPDTVNTTAEWNNVIVIDPTSELAKSVASHVNSSTPTPKAK